VQRLDLPDQRVNFFRCQFAGELGHVAFAVCDDIAKVFRGGGRGFVGNKRRPGKMAALGRFPVAFCAVFDVDGVGEQTCVSGWSLGKDCGGSKE